MNIAQSPDNAPFKPDWIKLHHYDYERVAGQNCLTRKVGDEIEEIPIEVYCGVDPASSLAITADYFVVVAIGVAHENNKYMLDCFRKRISPADQPQTIIDIFKKYHPRRMKIETTGYQEALRTAVRELMLKDNLYIPGIEKGGKPRTRKSERLMSLVPMFAKGQFYLRPEDMSAQQEFLSYPKGKHDDVMDAVWTALEGHKPCRVKKIDKNHKNEGPIKKVLDWLTM